MNELDSTTKKTLKYFNSNCFLVQNFKSQSLFGFIKHYFTIHLFFIQWL